MPKVAQKHSTMNNGYVKGAKNYIMSIPGVVEAAAAANATSIEE
jgi:hypothetical protein